jgi:hypothetical protein
MTNADLLEPVRAAFARVASVDVHDETLRRWHRQGLGGVKLQCWRVAGQLLTTASEVLEFIRRTNTKEPNA